MVIAANNNNKKALAIRLAAVFLFGMGLVGLLLPDFCVSFFGIQTNGVDGRNEIRAVYGGYGLALAALLTREGLHSTRGPGICYALMVSFMGMAFGRIMGLVLDAPTALPGKWPLVFFGVELALSYCLGIGAGLIA